MTWSVYQHWDPLKVCVVGRSYEPGFYSWITKSRIRSLFEKIAEETEEDYQSLIAKLQSFGVEVLRPNLPVETFINGEYVKPPMSPRDYTAMIGKTFYINEYATFPADIKKNYNNIRDPSWPDCNSLLEFENLPVDIKKECIEIHNFYQHSQDTKLSLNMQGCFDHIIDRIQSQGNLVKKNLHELINGAQVTRLGQDLYFGTDPYDQDLVKFQQILDQEFCDTKNHIVNTQGHSDGVYCAVCPGLIISSFDIDDYSKIYPGWEVLYLPQAHKQIVDQYTSLKNQNHHRWWIPGFEHDDDLVDLVEHKLRHWTGNIEETIFDLNLLIVDPKNVLVFSYNKQVFDVLEKYGITAHVVPFRHRYFWDGGIHCVTSDLHRVGIKQNYFKEKIQ
jgi:hypothetical protein